MLAGAVLILCALLGASEIARSTMHDRIVIVPPGLSGPVAVDWGKADSEYIKTFGVFYATLLGTITPRNADYLADRLSGMTDATAYPIIRKQILAVGKDPAFATSGSTSNFISNQVIFEPVTGKVFVVGENQTYSGFGTPKISPVVYEMAISILEGRPVVFSVSNYAGDQPRTAEWKLQHPTWEKDLAK
jgi:conjugal transfer pilus assembly protein TraE